MKRMMTALALLLLAAAQVDAQSTSNVTCSVGGLTSNATMSCVSAGGSSAITAGTTTITGGTNTRVVFNDGGVWGEDAGFTYAKATDAATAGQFISGLGSAAAPGLTVGGSALLSNGFYRRTDANIISTSLGGILYFELSQGVFSLKSDSNIAWYSGNIGSSAVDLGLGRDSAGVMKVTNGGAGLGTLYTSAGSAVNVGLGLGSNLLGFYGSGNSLFAAAGGNRTMHIDGVNTVRFYSTAQVGWSNGTGADNPLDTAQARYSAGVIKDTDGSTGIRGLRGGGAAVASAAALPLPTGNVFHVTGTTNVTSITSTNFQSGVVITLIFDGALTFTDGGNLVLAGNFVTTANDTITLAYDGTNWYEIARAVN